MYDYDLMQTMFIALTIMATMGLWYHIGSAAEEKRKQEESEDGNSTSQTWSA